MEGLVELIKANPGNTTVVVIGIVYVVVAIVRGRGKVLLSIAGGSEPEKPEIIVGEAIVKKIDERLPVWVAHSWSAAAPHLTMLREDAAAQQKQIDALNLAREDARIVAVRMDGRMLNLETGQAANTKLLGEQQVLSSAMNGKLDRLVDRLLERE